MVNKYIVIEAYYKPEKLTSGKLTKIIRTILDNGYEITRIGNRELSFIKGFGIKSKMLSLEVIEESTYMDKMLIKTNDVEIADKLESLIKELKLA